MNGAVFYGVGMIGKGWANDNPVCPPYGMMIGCHGIGAVSYTHLDVYKRQIQADTRYNYGEDRYQLLGKIEQRLFVVVYTVRNDSTRIISARKANQREVKYYENSTYKD